MKRENSMKIPPRFLALKSVSAAGSLPVSKQFRDFIFCDVLNKNICFIGNGK